jgi:hypothetical protein
MSYYECKRCKFTSKFKNDIRRHLDRKIKCGKDLDAYNYSDEELYKLSLIRIVIKEEEEDKIKLTCIHCNKIYSRLDSLNRHKLICKKVNNELDLSNTIIQNESKTQNQTIFIQDNNFNLKSFDEDWNVDHIDDYLKLFILLSQTKYTDFLKEVMKNKKNLNIIIEKNSDSGLVYKNESDNYVKIKIKELLEQLMIKINMQLQKIFDEYLSEKHNIEKSVLNTIKDEKINNNTKLSDYMNNSNLKKIVDTILLDILNKNREYALLVSKNLGNNKKIGY